MSGKCIAIELQGLELKIFIKLNPNAITLSTTSHVPPVVTLSGTPLDLLKIATARSDSPNIFPTSGIQIHGDIELSQQIKVLIQELNLDWEELLSRYISDIPAHQLGNSVRSFKAWSQHTIKALGQSLTEYLHEEIKLLPDHGEVTGFLNTVDYLRADLDRIEVRIQRLRQQS
ncbi:sterol-binding domain-containing protein [Candidatus Nitrosoglobus terrae]|uniref:Sterol-binding domain-containing protein n=2 Tax=Candidatus Nitrosoglobus terrae TaxID=1630141 RepID=A0A1Q2SLK6_9GAMM|nr:sterol-binding domain-containing protein [Candidatus Nitrosoglobus terrae]